MLFMLFLRIGILALVLYIGLKLYRSFVGETPESRKERLDNLKDKNESLKEDVEATKEIVKEKETENKLSDELEKLDESLGSI